MKENIIDILNKFKSFQIGTEEIKKFFHGNPFQYTIDKPIIVTSGDLLNVIHLYQSGKIRKEDLVYWADLMRLSDLYTYTDQNEEQECIAIVIDMIEDAFLYKKDISCEDVEMMKNILKGSEIDKN